MRKKFKLSRKFSIKQTCTQYHKYKQLSYVACYKHFFMKPLFYFGTKFNEHGHFIYNIQKEEFENTNFKFPHYDLLYKCNDNKREKGYNTKGDYSFHQKDNFTILSINGSITDDRFGTVTSFYIEEWQPISWFIERLKINKMAIEILNKLKEKYPNGLFFSSFCL